jgi:hypothetical protein
MAEAKHVDASPAIVRGRLLPNDAPIVSGPAIQSTIRSQSFASLDLVRQFNRSISVEPRHPDPRAAVQLHRHLADEAIAA